MPLDMPIADQGPTSQRQARGALAYLSGLRAEDNVCADYIAQGYTLCEKRWRGRAGEIDLIFEKSDVYIFVEVKSSSTLARAAQSLSARQLARICASAEDYISRTPKGFLTDMRIDVALVDQMGALEVHENASM